MKIKQAYANIKRVLVFNPSFIGDAILTTPLITAIRKMIPAVTIDFCVRPESAPVLAKTVGCNIITYDKRRKEHGLAGMWRFVGRLKRQQYDMAIVLHKSIRTSAIIALSGIPIKIGYKEAALAFIYDHTVHRDMSQHEVMRDLSLLSPIVDGYAIGAAKELAGGLVTYLDEQYYANIKDYFKTVTGNKPVIGLNPGSTWATKMWPTEYFIELADKLNSAGYAVAIFGGPADKIATDKVRAGINFEYFDFANKVPFELIPAVIKNLTAFVTNDSAPLHIAVSQNIPTVAIFGATVQGLGFYPYDNTSLVCENTALACRPCGLHGGKKCPEGHFKCMLDVIPDVVFAAVKKILARYN